MQQEEGSGAPAWAFMDHPIFVNGLRIPTCSRCLFALNMHITLCSLSISRKVDDLVIRMHCNNSIILDKCGSSGTC